MASGVPVLAAALLLGARALPAAQTTDPAPLEAPMIRYQVALPEARSHRVAVRMTVDGLAGDVLELSMPVWTPGSYLVREYARHVLELSARDESGRDLPADKVAKNAWRVLTGGARTVHVDYTLYAAERSVRTSHVDADHAFLSPAGTFLSIPARRHEPHLVTVAAPTGWEVFTGLAPHADGWLAEDYDALVDGPLEIGPHDVLRFAHRGVPHRVVLAGELLVDGAQLSRDVAAVVAEVATVFDVMPFADYTFIATLADGGGGGLEHRNSSVCMTSRWNLTRPDKYRDFLSLLAHEYFHAWNVKRFHPAALGDFDYDRENYTRDLWVAEGITSYYDDLCTLRAGFADRVEDYLRARAEAFRAEAERPGSRRMDLAASSFDAWIKHYRPDENSTNSSISYYTKGALVALMLDLRIRGCTAGARTLADALRLGWQRYTEAGTGFPDGAMEGLASEVAGTDLAPFFEAYVRGTGPLDPDHDLAVVGLRLARTPDKTKRPLQRDDDGFALEPWLGITTRAQGELCEVDTVIEGGPADRAGLNHEDVILAVDDMRVSHDTLQQRLDQAGGESVRLTLWRGQDLRTLDVVPELRRLETWKLVSVDEPSAAQRAAFEAWSGWRHPADGGGRLGSAAPAPPATADDEPEAPRPRDAEEADVH